MKLIVNQRVRSNLLFLFCNIDGVCELSVPFPVRPARFGVHPIAGYAIFPI
jgi:hypothetical protein